MRISLRSLSYPAVAPSILTVPREKIPEALALVESCRAQAPFIHIDVMDGIFVPATSFTAEEVRKIASRPTLVADTHIMVAHPFASAVRYVEAGADIVTFHYEACPDEASRRATIAAIKKAGAYAGLSLKPETPVEALAPYLGAVDLILLMSVEPGKGGQPFLPASLGRLAALRAMADQLPLEKRPLLEIDGGINDVTGPQAVAAGADILVAGSYLFGHPDFAGRLRRLFG
jgi:ribulose-phosphate 3-epimerase